MANENGALNTDEKWVNLEDIAEYLSVSKDTIRMWMKEGKLPINRAGKRYKFKISEEAFCPAVYYRRNLLLSR